jgi:hypothetical protein
MKNATKTAIVLVAAALLDACASGGGGGGGDQDWDAFKCIVAGPFCPLMHAEPGSPAKAPAPDYSSTLPVSFTSWADHLGQSRGVQAVGPDVVVRFEVAPDGSTRAISTFNDQASSFLYYGANGPTDLQTFRHDGADLNTLWAPHSTLSVQPGIEVLKKTAGYQSYFFEQEQVGNIGLFANPYVLGWNYQSFGVWSLAASGTALAAASYGAATPASAVPSNGSASFTGKLGGLYISPTAPGSMVAAELGVNVNFSTRSLSFASTGTTVTRDLATATAAPNLNLTGTLTYAPGSSSFSGTLTNAGGTMSGASNGRFYGPTAQELGGVFMVKSPTTVETFVGAYGAKR